MRVVLYCEWSLTVICGSFDIGYERVLECSGQDGCAKMRFKADLAIHGLRRVFQRAALSGCWTAAKGGWMWVGQS